MAQRFPGRVDALVERIRKANPDMQIVKVDPTWPTLPMDGPTTKELLNFARDVQDLKEDQKYVKATIRLLGFDDCLEDFTQEEVSMIEDENEDWYVIDGDGQDLLLMPAPIVLPE